MKFSRMKIFSFILLYAYILLLSNDVINYSDITYTQSQMTTKTFLHMPKLHFLRKNINHINF